MLPTVLSDDDMCPHNEDDEQDPPVGMRTPPTPPPHGSPIPVQGNAEDHRSELKRKADGILRSLSNFFAYLTYNTTSQNEAKKLLTIIHNVCKIIIISILCKIINIDIISIIHVISIMTIICFQLHYRPADIPHSSRDIPQSY